MRRPGSSGCRPQPQHILGKEERADDLKPGVERAVISLAPWRHRVGEHDADPRRDHCMMHTAEDPRGRVTRLGMQDAVETLLVHAQTQNPTCGPELRIFYFYPIDNRCRRAPESPVSRHGNCCYRGRAQRGTVSIFPNNRRALLAFVHDVLMAALSLAASLYLRLGDDAVDYRPQLTATYIVGFMLIAAIVFLLTGLYRGIWRYASLPDLFNIVRAVTLTVAVFLPVMFVLTRLEALPRSTLLIDWFVLIALLGAPRLAYRLFKDRGLDHILERARHRSVPVLLISTKDGADTFIREMLRDPGAVYRVVGVLADTPSRVGREIYRVPVLGTIDALEEVVERLDRRGRRPQKLIITAQNFPGAQVRALLERADALAIPLARLPRLTDFRRDLGSPERIIEPIALEDLLGRSQAVLDRDGMARLISGRRVLVTGAGGTIGAELARQVAAFSPSRLVLLDNGEFALYAIDAELREHFPGLVQLPLLRDVRERR